MRLGLPCLFILLSSIALAQAPANAPAPPQPTAPAATSDTGASESNVVYGNAAGTPLLLDVYQPQSGAQPYSAVLLIHGGSWMNGDKTAMAALGRWLARNNFVAFSIDYRLFDGKSKNPWPAQLDDAQRAVRWIRANAAKYHVDPAHIGAFGHSAGAQMAALLGEIDTRDNSDPKLAAYSSKVQAVVDASGPVDLTRNNDADGEIFLAAFLGATQKQNPEIWRAASPLFGIKPDTAPFLIFHGTQDNSVPIAESEQFAAALEKAGIPVTLFKVEDGHTFATQDAKRKLAIETVAFFNRTLRPAAPASK